MEAVIRYLMAFGLGAALCGIVALVLILRRPKFRRWVLGLEFFGKPLIKLTILAVLLLPGSMAAQQPDTAVTLMSSDTAFTAADSVPADSVPVTRLDTVGWSFTYQVTPGTMTVTDIWRFIISSLLCVGCVPADSVPTEPPDSTPPPVDSVPPPEPQPPDTTPTPPPVDTTTPPTPAPPTGTVIQRWDMNDWTIVGVNGGTTKWTNGGGNTPTWPHLLQGGRYVLNYPVTQYSSWLGWNFVGEVQFGSVTVDVDFRMNKPICTNTKGIRFDEGTKQWPGGLGWEGLYLNPTGGGSCGFTMSFGGMSPYTHHTGAYFTAGGPSVGNGLVVVNNLGDGQWHHLKLTYDVASAQKRMQLVIDGTLIAQPNGGSLQGSGFDGGCTSTVAGPGAFWQDGWLVACNTVAANLIGSGRLLDINKAGQAAGTVLELDNWVWSN